MSSSVSRDALLREAREFPAAARSPRGPEAGGSERPAEAWSLLPGSSNSTGRRYFTIGHGAGEGRRTFEPGLQKVQNGFKLKTINIFRDDVSWKVDGEGGLPSNFLRSYFKNFPGKTGLSP